ncbi:hypothetical protein DL765_000514 [Monosporascus sp. GIB2]|nr:hypothetical protein DL765_000514 [Monosporascus sp. GIB2]
MAPCSLCQNLQSRDDPSYARLAFDFKPSQLIESATVSSCLCCSLILEGIQHFADSSWSVDKDVSRAYAYGPSDLGLAETLFVELYFIDERPKLVLEYFHPQSRGLSNGSPPGISTNPGPGDFLFRWPAIQSKPSVNGPIFEPDSLKWVTSHLNECLLQHPICASANKTPELPHRVLAFGPSPDGCIAVKLQENDGPKNALYAALSHCWGSHQNCTTTTKTLEERKQGIPWDEIPQTFRDSISYCLKIGINYLWIDALCIIQDSDSDWQLESAKMADIYENSHITLAATAANCDAAGLVASRQDFKPEYQLTTVPTECSPIRVREKLHHWDVPTTQMSMRRNPLLGRGWAFQERILSPRILHFCSQELVWECGQLTNCECGCIRPNAGIKRQFPADMFRVDLAEANLSDNGNASYEDEDIADRLTKPTDCLPALSGLAKRAAVLFNDYLAGIWSKTIRADILWRVDKLEPGAERPAMYRGPSWSWVSVTSQIKYWSRNELIDYHSADPFLDFTGGGISAYGVTQTICTVDVAGENPFGEVQSAKLVITGKLVIAALGYTFSRVGTWADLQREYDPFQYQLFLQVPGHGLMEFSFFPDYILSDRNDYYIPDGAKIYLLEIFSNLCLVLQDIEAMCRRIPDFAYTPNGF